MIVFPRIDQIIGSFWNGTRSRAQAKTHRVAYIRVDREIAESRIRSLEVVRAFEWIEILITDKAFCLSTPTWTSWSE